jgi:hypothetical protein
MKSSRTLLLLTCACALLLAACLPGANEQLGVANAAGTVAGFWRGLWQGFLMPLSLLLSLFTDSVQVYEVHNNGAWYNVGYFLGVSMCLGGGGHGSGRVWRR